MMRRQRGMISVVRRKLITSDESFFTNAPITPRLVRRRYSKGRDLDVVLRNGYRKSGMWARVVMSASYYPSIISGFQRTVEEQGPRIIV